MSQEQLRICRECELELPIERFSQKASGYVFPRCKTCMRGAKSIQKRCRNCEAEFPATTKSAKTYCSPECKKVYEAVITSKKRKDLTVNRNRAKEEEVRRNQEENPEVFNVYASLARTRTMALQSGGTQYFTGLKCKNGHLAPKYTKNSLCATCLEERRKESEMRRRADGRYSEQLQRSNAKERQRRAEDDDYRQNRLKLSKDWQSRNRPHLAAYMQRQRDENPQFLIQQRLQTRLNRVLKRVGSKRAQAMDRYLGCTSEELAAHLESLFCNTMSWQTRGEWHVDHIRPCSSFDLTDDEQVQVCFNWRNLQPMIGVENMSKQDRYEGKDEDIWIAMMTELGYEGELYPVFAQSPNRNMK